MSSSRDPHSEINSLLPPGPPLPPHPNPQPTACISSNSCCSPWDSLGPLLPLQKMKGGWALLGGGVRSCRAAASSLVLWSRLCSSSRHLSLGPQPPSRLLTPFPLLSPPSMQLPARRHFSAARGLWCLLPSATFHAYSLSAPFAERGAIGSQSQNQAAGWRQPEDTASETVPKDIWSQKEMQK